CYYIVIHDFSYIESYTLSLHDALPICRGRLLRAVVASASKGCCISNHPPHNEPHLCDAVPAQTLAHDRLSLGEVFITQWMVMQSALIFEVFHDVCKSVIQPKLRKRHGI